jgi:lipopolysaccharide export system permease protein
MFSILDRYLLRTWAKIFTLTALGFPLVVTIIELSDKLSRLIDRDVPASNILMGHVMGLPEKVFQVIPAAVLFATVFSVGAMARNSELVAIKAAGRSFHRTLRPVIAAAVLVTVLTTVIGEIAPVATRRQAELLGDVQQRERNTRFNFVYRAEEGWVYLIRSLDVRQDFARQLVLERKGVGAEYPTLMLSAAAGFFSDSLGRWRLDQGHYRVITGLQGEMDFAFDSTVHRVMFQTPEDLLAEPKAPREMRYAELGAYIQALEFSGGDVKKIKVQQALKLSIPFTCIVIALFGAPLANTSPRAAGAFGVGVSLGTTLIFLILLQLSQAVGAGGILPPTLAAWSPNIAFGLGGLILFVRART